MPPTLVCIHKLVNNHKIYLYLGYVGNVTGKWIWILHHAYYATWLDTLEVSVPQFSEPDIISDRKGTQVPKTQVKGLKQVKNDEKYDSTVVEFSHFLADSRFIYPKIRFRIPNPSLWTFTEHILFILSVRNSKAAGEYICISPKNTHRSLTTS